MHLITTFFGYISNHIVLFSVFIVFNNEILPKLYYNTFYILRLHVTNNESQSGAALKFGRFLVSIHVTKDEFYENLEKSIIGNCCS